MTAEIITKIGYHQHSHMAPSEAVRLVQESCDRAGLKLRAAVALSDTDFPAGAIRVGQVREHDGAPLHALYVTERQS